MQSISLSQIMIIIILSNIPMNEYILINIAMNIF